MTSSTSTSSVTGGLPSAVLDDPTAFSPALLARAFQDSKWSVLSKLAEAHSQQLLQDANRLRQLSDTVQKLQNLTHFRSTDGSSTLQSTDSGTRVCWDPSKGDEDVAATLQALGYSLPTQERPQVTVENFDSSKNLTGMSALHVATTADMAAIQSGSITQSVVGAGFVYDASFVNNSDGTTTKYEWQPSENVQTAAISDVSSLESQIVSDVQGLYSKVQADAAIVQADSESIGQGQKTDDARYTDVHDRVVQTRDEQQTLVSKDSEAALRRQMQDNNRLQQSHSENEAQQTNPALRP
jgi:hypothetical protein